MESIALNRHTESQESLLLVFMIVAFTTAFSLLAYHPYYFGDELLPMNISVVNNISVISIFSDLNNYKPRLVWNMIWTIISVYGLPRIDAMIATTTALCAIAVIIFRMARKLFYASPLISALSAMTAVTSRFGIVFYYDYVAGTIEAISFAFFAWLMMLIFFLVKDIKCRTLTRYISILLISVAIAFTHERYIAGVMTLGALLIIFELWKGGHPDKKLVGFSLLLMALPLCLFILATNYLSTAPLDTGTGGLVVKLGTNTLKAIFMYIPNVFLGSNFGHEWLVGKVNMGNMEGRIVAASLGALFLGAWSVALWRREKVPEALAIGFALISIMLSMIVVASLPGTSRLEGRWMYPVGELAVLLAVACYRGKSRALLVTLLLATNIAYFLLGSQNTIYNISSSHFAEALARGLKTIVPSGSRGILLGAPDVDWTLRYNAMHPNGLKMGDDAFCRVVMNSKPCIYAFSPSDKVDLSKFDFGLMYVRSSGKVNPTFRLLSKVTTGMLLAPNDIPQNAGIYLGNADSWTGWAWAKAPPIGVFGAELSPGIEGYISLPVSKIDGKILVYRAQSQNGALVPMRLQVNWQGPSGRFIGTSIDVVNVGPALENFSTLISAPQGASFGQIYANLHDGAKGEVLLNSIRLIDNGKHETVMQTR